LIVDFGVLDIHLDIIVIVFVPIGWYIALEIWLSLHNEQSLNA